ncbi:hypothetical protein [Paenibacillus lactis]|uniref:Uncharacterized protein n=1 Tax=Paenibacillus lactis TaxID=228574 RepID=A0ABS4F9T8_9BACL|nr:hypothetical protein [Paenibacillus lactis]MBP1893022.1 hypothetical protein [Paenibacillus lactis]HAF97514.1 hypothetical protein [Paenibacillus lactis]
MNQINEMTKEELQQRTKEIVDFLTEKNEEAKKAGIDQHGHFYTSVAFTLGSLIGFDFEPQGYGPMLGTMLDSLTDGLQTGAQSKGVKGTFIKVVRD